MRAASKGRAPPAGTPFSAGDDPFETNYDAQLGLAADASRFDLSPAWLSWVGAAPAIELLGEVGVEAIHEHDVALANRFRAGLGIEPGDSALVALPREDGLKARLEAADVMFTDREGLFRFSFHLFNTEGEVDRALE